MKQLQRSAIIFRVSTQLPSTMINSILALILLFLGIFYILLAPMIAFKVINDSDFSKSYLPSDLEMTHIFMNPNRNPRLLPEAEIKNTSPLNNVNTRPIINPDEAGTSNSQSHNRTIINITNNTNVSGSSTPVTQDDNHTEITIENNTNINSNNTNINSNNSSESNVESRK